MRKHHLFPIFTFIVVLVGNISYGNEDFMTTLLEVKALCTQSTESRDNFSNYVKRINTAKEHLVSLGKDNESNLNFLIEETSRTLRHTSSPSDALYYNNLMRMLLDIDYNRAFDLADEALSSSEIALSYKSETLSIFDGYRLKMKIRNNVSDTLYEDFRKRFSLLLSHVALRCEDDRLRRSSLKILTGMYPTIDDTFPGASSLIDKFGAVDRETGIKIIRDIISREDLQFHEKEWYMQVLSETDSQYKKEYIRQITEFVNRGKISVVGVEVSPTAKKLEYAKKLLTYGAIDEATVDSLEKQMKKEIEARKFHTHIEIKDGVTTSTFLTDESN